MQVGSLPGNLKAIRISIFIFLASAASVFALGFNFTGSIRFAGLQSIVFLITTSRNSYCDSARALHNLLIKHVLTLLIITFCWVSYVSTEIVFIRISIFIVFVSSLLVLRRLVFSKTEDLNQDHAFAPARYVSKILILVISVLIVRSWTNLLFALLPLLASFKLLSPRNNFSKKHHRYSINAGISILLIFGSWLSHLFVDGNSSRFWVSYDQVFRSAIATSVTRWGWTDSSFGFGHSLTYHWLPEALGGVLSRFAGLTESDVISRLLPAFGILFSAVVILKLLTFLQINSKIVWPITFTVLTLANSFETYSLGTLWGGAFSILLTGLFLESISDQRDFPHFVSYSVVPFFLILSQSALGLALAMGVGLTLLLLAFRHVIQMQTAIKNIVLLVLTLFIVQRVFFHTSPLLSDSFPIGVSNFLNFPLLHIEHGSTPGSSDMAIRANSFFYLLFLLSSVSLSFILPVRSERIKVWRSFLISQFLGAVLLANFFSLGGGYSGKFLVPIQLLGLLGAVLAIYEILSRATRQLSFFLVGTTLLVLMLAKFFVMQNQNLDRMNQSLLTFSIVFLAFFTCIGTMIVWSNRFKNVSYPLRIPISYSLLVISFCTFVWSTSDVIKVTKDRLASETIDASFFLGSVETRSCLDFVRLNTPEDSVIATTLWKLPTSVLDERYVLTSLLSQRRSLVDGPVFAHVNWSSTDEFESLKNLHTSFLNNLDEVSKEQLKSLGASYFLLDTRFTNEDQTWISLDLQEVVFGNSECSVLKL